MIIEQLIKIGTRTSGPEGGLFTSGRNWALLENVPEPTDRTPESAERLNVSVKFFFQENMPLSTRGFYWGKRSLAYGALSICESQFGSNLSIRKSGFENAATSAQILPDDSNIRPVRYST